MPISVNIHDSPLFTLVVQGYFGIQSSKRKSANSKECKSARKIPRLELTEEELADLASNKTLITNISK